MTQTSNSEFYRYIDAFSSKKILILGDLILDEYIWGNAERISPEAPIPVVNILKTEVRLGGAANVAMSILALGGQPELTGIIGDDDSGAKFLKTAESLGLSTDGIFVVPGHITPLKTRVIASSQQMLRIDNERIEPIENDIRGKLIEYLITQLENSSALLISDYAKGLIGSELLAPVLDKAKSLELLITVDPKPVNMHLYKGVTLVSPNLKETAIASGVKITDQKSLSLAASILMDKISPKALLVTRGSDGLSLFESDSEYHLPAMASQVYDVSGAGDTVIGTLTLSLAAGAHLKDAVEIANCAAGVVVRKPGVATISPVELKDALKNRLEWDKSVS
ncbi:bifunctional hydroxymethylpyrimidine kinase/phosphomethylpyrimidine kinase [bacterium]|nr:bifunctional hydroxymethylpyrimidine kinase/phosphomethylpyrimidine kinase [bacterium]MBU1025245.1 bifunctional hydroxymethylpyrimidine kinase/phosphomethylpyrimidine kinase [bacterium]